MISFDQNFCHFIEWKLKLVTAVCKAYTVCAWRLYKKTSTSFYHCYKFPRYPQPKLRNKELFSQAAMISIKRKGQPWNEDWMNYWRHDADFNDHHQYEPRDFYPLYLLIIISHLILCNTSNKIVYYVNSFYLVVTSYKIVNSKKFGNKAYTAILYILQ